MDKILAQDEVDALLRGLSGGELETETDIPEDDSGIVPFDLANQDRIIRGRMPVLEIINDRFARLCTNALTNAVRKRVELNPISIDMTKFGEFMRSLPVPTSINIFKMEPLRGNALIVVDARLVFSLVEIFSAASAHSPRSRGVSSRASNRPSWIASSSWPFRPWRNPGGPCMTSRWNW